METIQKRKFFKLQLTCNFIHATVSAVMDVGTDPLGLLVDTVTSDATVSVAMSCLSSSKVVLFSALSD